MKYSDYAILLFVVLVVGYLFLWGVKAKKPDISALFPPYKQNNKRMTMKEKHEIKFEDMHSLGIETYNASDVEIRYGTLYLGAYYPEDEGDPREIAPSKKPGDEEYWDANIIALPVFADPVKLSWHDLEDRPIEYIFNFNDIFPDRIVPYPKEWEDRIYWDEPLALDPGIILEIDNRTLNIYTRIRLHIMYPQQGNVISIETETYLKKVFSKEF